MTAEYTTASTTLHHYPLTHNPTRVDEGRKCCTLFAIRVKTRTVVGRGKNRLLSDPGSELRLGRGKEKEKCEENRWDGTK